MTGTFVGKTLTVKDSVNGAQGRQGAYTHILHFPKDCPGPALKSMVIEAEPDQRNDFLGFRSA
jgi:hypothetical protein